MYKYGNYDSKCLKMNCNLCNKQPHSQKHKDQEHNNYIVMSLCSFVLWLCLNLSVAVLLMLVITITGSCCTCTSYYLLHSLVLNYLHLFESSSWCYLHHIFVLSSNQILNYGINCVRPFHTLHLLKLRKNAVL